MKGKTREEEKGSLSELHSPLGSGPLTCLGPDLVTALLAQPDSASSLASYVTFPLFNKYLLDTYSKSGDAHVHLTLHPVPNACGAPWTRYMPYVKHSFLFLFSPWNLGIHWRGERGYEGSI